MFLKRHHPALLSLVILSFLNLGGCTLIQNPVVKRKCLELICVIVDNISSKSEQ